MKTGCFADRPRRAQYGGTDHVGDHQYFDGRLDLRVKNTTRETVELIYEIPRKTAEKNLLKKRQRSMKNCIRLNTSNM